MNEKGPLNENGPRYLLGMAVASTIACILQLYGTIRYVRRLPDDTLGVVLSIIMADRMREVTVALAVLVSLIPAALSAGEISVTYRFDDPTVVESQRGFSRITFPATVQSGLPGEPGYPFRGAAILLPPGEAAAAVRIERRGWQALGGPHRLHPVQLPVKAQESESGRDAFLYTEQAYAVDRWVQPPDSRFTTHYCRGHAIAVGCFSPVRYHPVGGEVGFYREVEVTVETEGSGASAGALEMLRTDSATRAQVAAIIDNPGDLVVYGAAPPTAMSADCYEYLIVTRDSLRDAFIPLRDFHTRRGLRARIRTVEQIEKNFFLRIDAAAMIRAAIKHEYVNRGITHVLLGGDADGPPGDPKVVPYRGLYSAVNDRSSFTEDNNIPADIYFAALDGDWNADGDDRWGEPGEEDLFPEIAVGRACVQTVGEVERFVGKTMLYQDAPVAGEVRRALLLGEWLWESPETWGADELEEYVGLCTENDITTCGIPDDFDTTALFDRDIYHWDKYEALAEINAGTHWVVHSGHCAYDMAMKFYLRDVTDYKFTNDGVSANFIIAATAGCYAASFDNFSTRGFYCPNVDCIAEKMLKIQHGAVAFRGNSRYGWLDPGTTNSTSHLFIREFYDAIFTEGYHTLGEADRRSKEELVPYIALSSPNRAAEFRWDYYQINLLGDPALDPWTDTPESLSVSHPASIERYAESIELFAPIIPDSRAVLYHDGVCYGLGVGTPIGYIVLHRLLPLPDTIDVIELSVSAHNHYTYRDTIAITGVTGTGTPPIAAALRQNVPNPFNPLTVIRFSLDREGPVDLRVYDVTGHEVDRLVHRRMEAGAHEVTWRPTHLPSGLYMYVLRAGGISFSRKAVLIR